MKRKFSLIQIRLYLIGSFILIAGLAGAVWLYIHASPDRSNVAGYEFADGEAHVITRHDSKIYRHDLELFGGKAAVLADDLNRWLASLWQRRRLAYLLAAFAIGISLCFFRAAHRLSGGAKKNQGP